MISALSKITHMPKEYIRLHYTESDYWFEMAMAGREGAMITNK
jgi:hypothetical protein